MANKVKLTEADLNRIVKKVMNEQRFRPGLAARSAASINPKVKALAAYLKQNNITPQEIAAAQKLNAGGGVSPTPARPQPGPARPQPQGSRAVTSTGTTPVKPQP